MATTVHIPAPLLAAVDRRAAAMKISRNRYIVTALERSVERQTEWSDRLWNALARSRRDDGGAADAMLAGIKRARASRRKPPL